jgi:hypothetical protein
MTRKGKTVRRTAKVLTNPQISRVSVVEAGANMMPWSSVKSADGAVRLNDPTPEVTDIASISFAAAEFADVTAVESWMTGNGYGEFKIDSVAGGGFTAVSSGVAPAFDGEPAPVQLAAGVTVYVGRLAEPAADAPTAAEEPTGATEGTKSMTIASKAEAVQSFRTKSISTISDLTYAVRSLLYIVSDKEFEAIYKALPESASLPAIRTAATSLTDALGTLAAEEVAAFAAYVAEEIGEPPALEVAEILQAADKSETVLTIEPVVVTAIEPGELAPFVDPQVTELSGKVEAITEALKALTDGLAADRAAREASVAEAVEARAKAEMAAEERLKSLETAQARAGRRSVGIDAAIPGATPADKSQTDRLSDRAYERRFGVKPTA